MRLDACWLAANHGVIATRVKWVAAQQAPNRPEAAENQASSMKRFGGVVRTAWCETATVGDHGSEG
jgi:hypothetical protein